MIKVILKSIFYFSLVLAVGCNDHKKQMQTAKTDSATVQKKTFELDSISEKEIDPHKDSIPTILNFDLTATGQCKKCQTNYAATVERTIYSLRYSDVQLFLCSFGKVCKNNAEFSEYGNEIIFKLLAIQPSVLINVLSEDTSLEVDVILNEIADPLLDYDLKVIYASVELIEAKDVIIKNQILKSLSIALNQ